MALADSLPICTFIAAEDPNWQKYGNLAVSSMCKRYDDECAGMNFESVCLDKDQASVFVRGRGGHSWLVTIDRTTDQIASITH